MQDELFFTQAAEELIALTIHTRRRPIHRDMSSLSAGECGMLLYLSEREEGVTAGQISRDLQIGSGGVANMLNTLEKKGYVTRTMSPSDRRSVVAAISDAGMELINAKKKEVCGMIGGFLMALGREDTLELLRLYKKMLDISDRYMREHGHCCD